MKSELPLGKRIGPAALLVYLVNTVGSTDMPGRN